MSDADRTTDYTPVVSGPAPREVVRELEQHPDVEEAGITRDRDGVAVDAVLVGRHHTVPAGVARIIYRRNLGISDVSERAARRRLYLTARIDG